LTPEGKKRNPFSFSPFLGGIRICLGKTFIEEVSKVTLPNILKSFDFEMEDAKNFVHPFNNMLFVQEPIVELYLKKRC
jgi:cytochrome P450